MIVTFHNASINEQAIGLVTENITVIKHYGRRMVIDTPDHVDVIMALFGGDDYVYGIELDLMAMSTVMKTTWNLNESEPFGLHTQALRSVTNGTAVISVLDSGLPEVAWSAFEPRDGYDFVTFDGGTRNPNATDPGNCQSGSGWHGTKVVSILEAVAPGSELIVLRVLDACGVGFASDIADAVVWAAGGRINGISDNALPSNVISMSISGRGRCPSYLQSAVTQALGLGSVVVVAAGNAAENASFFFPGNCKGVMTLGASTRKGLLASYSNWGNVLAFSAPGGNTDDPVAVLTVGNNGLLAPAFATGTSFAVPHAAGLFSLFHGLGISVTHAVDYFSFTDQPDCGERGVLDGGNLTSIMASNLSFASAACPTGYYQISSGCMICSPGYYCINLIRYQCSRGSYAGAYGLTVCSPCQAGKYNSNYAATACVFCDIGTFSASLATVCTSCSPGTYNKLQGQAACISCTAANLLTCAIGYTVLPCSTTVDTACVACPSVPYCSYVSANQCNNANGSPNCNCNTGFEKSSDGMACVACPNVPFCSYISTPCKDLLGGPNCNCMAGFEKFNGACRSCAPGKYKLLGDDSACVSFTTPSCTQGQYVVSGSQSANSFCASCSGISLPSSNSIYTLLTECGWQCNAGFSTSLP